MTKKLHTLQFTNAYYRIKYWNAKKLLGYIASSTSNLGNFEYLFQNLNENQKQEQKILILMHDIQKSYYHPEESRLYCLCPQIPDISL